MQTIWHLVLLFLGLVIGVFLGYSKRPSEYVDDKTKDEVIDALYRSGLVKNQVVNAMVEMRKIGIVFFKQTQ